MLGMQVRQTHNWNQAAKHRNSHIHARQDHMYSCIIGLCLAVPGGSDSLQGCQGEHVNSEVSMEYILHSMHNHIAWTVM